jgi:hypothetical protein
MCICSVPKVAHRSVARKKLLFTDHHVLYLAFSALGAYLLFRILSLANWHKTTGCIFRLHCKYGFMSFEAQRIVLWEISFGMDYGWGSGVLT